MYTDYGSIASCQVHDKKVTKFVQKWAKMKKEELTDKK